MTRIRAVFFDLYGTLARFDPPREEIQDAAAREHGLSVTAGGIARGYRTADEFMASQNADEPVRSMSPAERDRFFARYEQLVLEDAGHRVDTDTAARIWRTVRSQRYGLALFPDVLQSLEAFAESGLTVGVISNMNETGEAVGARLGLSGRVDLIVTSLEAGAEKPHPPIFLEALRRADARPEEAVHVGDQPTSDVEGARAVGMRAVLMDRYGGHEEYESAPRISALAELPDTISALERAD